MGSEFDVAALNLDEPVFILTCARSGSTLLRMILDSHDELACPPETNVALACVQLWDTWISLDSECSPSVLTETARLHIKSSVSSMYREYLTRRGKRRWCDKSLVSGRAASKLVHIFGQAKFICLYRHAMDMIYSGLEVNPFGQRGYGFDMYGGPNTVAALAGYWTDQTRQILEFEKSHPGICFRVHYEQLVLEPERVTDDILRFIGVPPSPGITQRALTRRDLPTKFEFGDYKIYAANQITSASVGRGMRVPASLIGSDLRSALNEVLTQLGYTPVDQAWEMSTVPPTLLTAGPCQAPSAAEDQDEEASLLSFREIDCEFRRRIAQNVKVLPETLTRWNTMAIIAYSLRTSRLAAAWRIDLQSGEVDSDLDDVDFESLDTEWAFTGEIDTWRSVIDGTVNLASAVLQSSIRVLARDLVAEDPSPTDMAHAAMRVVPVLAYILGLGM